MARDDGTAAFAENATFLTRLGLSDRTLYSFEAANLPNSFIRHRDFALWVEERDGSPLFAADATFRLTPAAAGRPATAASGSVSFDAPALGLVGRQVVSPYVAGGVRFTAATDENDDAVVGVVRNNATSACADPADNNQKLGTGRNTFPDGSIGLSDFAIRATFDTPLAPAPGGAVRVAVEFQAIAGTRLRLRLYDAAGAEIAASVVPAEPAAGTCGFPGPARARRIAAAEARTPVAYALMDTIDIGVVFVLDDFRWSPAP